MAGFHWLIVEALVVGVLTVVVGTLVGFLIGKIAPDTVPSECKDWNKYYQMEITLFFTGVLVHLLCEAVGVNRWYCKNSYACSHVKAEEST